MITKEQIEHAMGAALFDSMESDSEDFGRGFEDGAKWAIEKLQPEIDSLKAENEKIKTNEAELARLVERWNGIAAENNRLQTKLEAEFAARDVWMAENERLKKLIAVCMKDIKNNTPNLAWIKMNKAIAALNP